MGRICHDRRIKDWDRRRCDIRGNARCQERVEGQDGEKKLTPLSQVRSSLLALAIALGGCYVSLVSDRIQEIVPSQPDGV